MLEVKSVITWMGLFIALLVLSAFAANGQYFTVVGGICIAIIGFIGFAGILTILGEIRDHLISNNKSEP